MLIRRCVRRVLPRRESWHNLGAYTLTEKDAAAWRELRARDLNVESVATRFEKDTTPPINWKYWEDTITHKDIVTCMKAFYEHQMSVLDSALREDHRKIITENQKEGWHLWEEGVSSCRESVKASDEIIDNGARALWISFHNPLPWQIKPSEWVDSDQYWQAYFEKHMYRHTTTGEPADPESEDFQKMVDADVSADTRLWNDRSDTPTNNQNMTQLPSWEYYDIHRRAFVEHMVYYLLRTGGDYRFFPEVPPWQWLTHIEQLRWQFVSVTQRRRSVFQMEKEARVMALDMQPLDYEHDGDEFHQKFIATEKAQFESVAARLMGNFILFCYPYIPVQTTTALHRALGVDDGQGKLYSLGDDVNALFYKPGIPTEFPKPSDAFNSLMDHVTLSGQRFNPAYSTMLSIFTQLLDSRPQPWFKTEDESVGEAFMRRLKVDDPSRPVYEAYLEEMKERFGSAVEVPADKMVEQTQAVERRYRQECAVYRQLLYAMNDNIMTKSRAETDRLLKMHEAGQLQGLLDSGALVVVDEGRLPRGEEPPAHRAAFITDSQTLIENIQEFEELKERTLDAVMATKTALDVKKK
ncbi:unnamed protein product [Vitrella brassicaformis CCMP3155]|uniref:Uncharacterized protein n=2 Tax=Vitrella brassicaformis TaxID=1169539 RepID=A0A0G4GGU5_VITBC|nr:unnamed protein product [Vitrella brassicaformis CCMP3155]|mmetsp:Transcript_47516/g.118742  ORF Transcript_47516/g.118742 Transcript_47516/m.118742 type:complete len:581 (+) Transcript_47516:172-1914(+)|eukprot:CEM28865.1 unnamed protein product [Vitrella brassicaformis CCMP3155]